MPKILEHEAYTVGWICPLEVEQIAAIQMLDEKHGVLTQSRADRNVYNLGSINGHNVVVAGLYQPGNCPAATVVTQMRMTFPNLQFGLLVGIGGGVPVATDNGMIRLGHVVVSKPTGKHSGAIQYDHGKAKNGVFERTGFLAPPPTVLLNAAQDLAVSRAMSDTDPIEGHIRRIDTSRRGLRRFRYPGAEKDRLFPPGVPHQSSSAFCDESGCDFSMILGRPADDDGDDSPVVIHRGTIAAGELVVKDAILRDYLAQRHDILCFEMEAAGVLVDFPCIVIRGIADYCDSHKNDEWHGYAAAAAASESIELRDIFNIRKTYLDRSTKPKRIFIRGHAGVGKTTLCKKAVFEFINSGTWRGLFDRVLWIPLRNLKSQTGRYSLHDLFCDEFFSQQSKRDDLAAALRTVCDKVDGGRTLFIVDGLDEIWHDLSRTSALFRFMVSLLNQPNIVVMSRPSVTPPAEVKPFDLELETIGFDPEQVAAYIERLEADNAKKIQSFLDEHLLIRDLVRIPIQLDALCFAWSDVSEDEPDTMTNLYRAIERGLWRKYLARLGKKTDGRLVNDHDNLHVNEVMDLVGYEAVVLEGLAFTGLYNNISSTLGSERLFPYTLAGLGK
ncbi:LOW QUALITY PROTEIN: hypothetical protein ColTof3_14608 [Colletotrichum tofieldiae]|nr:LOW QUALITY PROTEIN: hypothetical protein ColTof3_14608 [Colletotrichum tofieldiae]